MGIKKHYSENKVINHIVQLILKLPESTRNIWLGNIVEYISTKAVAPEGVASFLKWCFYM